MKKNLSKVLCSIMTFAAITCASPNAVFASTQPCLGTNLMAATTNGQPQWEKDRTYTQTRKEKYKLQSERKVEKNSVTETVEASSAAEAEAKASADYAGVVKANARLKCSEGNKKTFSVTLTIEKYYIEYTQLYKEYEDTYQTWVLRSPAGSVINGRTRKIKTKYLGIVSGDSWREATN